MANYARLLSFFLFSIGTTTLCANADSLPSWKEGPIKQNLLQFIQEVTDIDSPNFVPESERIASFNFDGTLFAKAPLPLEAMAAQARLKKLAQENPRLKSIQPYKAALENDYKTLQEENTLVAFLNQTPEEYENSIEAFLKDQDTSKSKDSQLLQPTLELLELLNKNQFSIYVTSSSTQETLVPVCEKILHIPKDHIIGSKVATETHTVNGEKKAIRADHYQFHNSGKNKLESFKEQTGGKLPIISVGSSLKDIELLKATANQTKHPHLPLVIDVSEADDDFALSNPSLTRAAELNAWQVVDPKKAFKPGTFRVIRA